MAKNSAEQSQPDMAARRRSFDGAILDIAGAAAFLGVSEKMLRARVARRMIPFRRWGGRICFVRSELIEFLQSLEGCGLKEALEKGQN